MVPLHVALFDDWSKLCTALQPEHTSSALQKLKDLLLTAGKEWLDAQCLCLMCCSAPSHSCGIRPCRVHM